MIFKRLFITFIMVFALGVAYASDGVKFRAEMLCDFDPDNIAQVSVKFKPLSDVSYSDIELPTNSTVTVSVISTQSEKRFHKSGFFRFNIDSCESNGTCVKIYNPNVVGVGKKYDQIDKKEAAKTGAELTTTTVAGFMLPGVDLAYYFVKGAIQNEKADTRFKSGIHNAYDNSVFWFFMKGKPISLKQGDLITVILSKNETEINEE